MSCSAGVGLTRPAVASSPLVGTLPYADEAVADADKVPGSPAARHSIQRCLMTFSVSRQQGLGAKIRP